jgi:hypothetical protein
VEGEWGRAGLDEAATMVGREGVAVVDPFFWHRGDLPVKYARGVDERATELGELLADEDSAQLRRRASELGSPLAELDPALLARGRRLEQYIVVQVDVCQAAMEDAAVLRGWADANPGSPELAADAAAREELLEQARERMWELSNPSSSPRRYLDGVDWDRVVEWVAVTREEAIREALITRWVDNGADAPGARVKQIGAGDLGQILADDWNDDLRARQEDGKADGVRVIDLNEVDSPLALDSMENVIGRARVRRMTTSLEPLAKLLEEAPDEWVRQRRRELGHPRDCLNRGDVRETLRLEMQRDAALKERDRYLEDAAEHLQSDPERAAASGSAAMQQEQAADGFQDQLTELFEQGKHLDAMLVADDHRFGRAVAYEDELQFRVHQEIAERVERSVVNPPGAVIDLIGHPWDLAEPERQQWEALTRATEKARIGIEVTVREGVDLPVRDPDAERELAERIDRFRERHGMEPRAQVALDLPRDAPGYEMG